MNAELPDAPSLIAQLASRCVTHVKHRFNLELDYTIDTLSVVDYFMSAILADECGGERPLPGDPRRGHAIHLFGGVIGAYFGEVIRRVFPCRWRLLTEAPRDWLLEFEYVPLRFNPAGAAAEALLEEVISDWYGSLATSPEETESLAERLALAPPLPEEQFYTLTTRLEALQIAEEWLRRHWTANGHIEPPTRYSSADYDRLFRDREPR